MTNQAIEHREVAEFKVPGMHCESCANRVREFVLKVPGVQSADINLAAGRASVTYDPGPASQENIVAAIAAAGYQGEAL